MGLLYQNKSEHDFYARAIAEAAQLLGEPALIYIPDVKKYDINNDKQIVYQKPILINIIFEENPKPILKKNNWLTEDPDLPYVVYIPKKADDYSDVNAEKDSLIKITNIQVDNMYESDFIITNIVGSKLRPLFWECKLAPYRPNVKGKSHNSDVPDSTKHGYSYITRKRGTL